MGWGELFWFVVRAVFWPIAWAYHDGVYAHTNTRLGRVWRVVVSVAVTATYVLLLGFVLYLVFLL